MEISSFYKCAPKIMIRQCMVPEIWCTMDGQTDRRKKWHIEVGTPPKNKTDELELVKGKRRQFLYCLFCFISMYCVLNALSYFTFVFTYTYACIHTYIHTHIRTYTYFYASKNITSYTFLLVFKILKRLQCILNLIMCWC